MLKGKMWLLAAALVLGGLCVGQAMAQEDGWGDGKGKGGGKDKGGGPDKVAKDQKKAKDMKQELGVTDDEWTALSPKLQKVLSLQRDIKDGGRGGPPGGPKASDGETPEPMSDLAKATQALAAILLNKDAPVADIKAAIQAVRDARAKAKTALEQAQKELKELVTVRQEAILLQKGLLD